MSTIADPKAVAGRKTEFRSPPPASAPMQSGSHPEDWPHALEQLIVQWEADQTLAEPNRLPDRLNALDRLDAYLPSAPQASDGSAGMAADLARRANAMRDRLEAANGELYQAIRAQVQRRSEPHGFLQWMLPLSAEERFDTPADGMGYDYLDELISGVFQFEEPEHRPLTNHPERLFYQPTPARHIFSLIGLAGLTAADVFVDLGSGLGHVPMLVSICTECRSFGIELESTYVERAQQCAQSLNLNRVTLIQQDVLQADLSVGTVFYLYTPFMGSILSAALDRLKREAATRQIRVCSYGPCTPVIANESWLAPAALPDPNLITVFRSCA